MSNCGLHQKRKKFAFERFLQDAEMAYSGRESEWMVVCGFCGYFVYCVGDQKKFEQRKIDDLPKTQVRKKKGL